MLDFTSALYLGLRHGSATLGSWDALSLGRPALLEEPPGAESVSRQLAWLQGFEAATLLPSTLHLFRDLFRMLAGGKAAILADACAYPIARWGAAYSGAVEVPLLSFAHHDAGVLARMARHAAREGRRPIVLTDGYCPACGLAAPLTDYADTAARHGGCLVVDDTQALGILGALPNAGAPYGWGGGGSARWHHAYGPHVVVGASLAKGFGAPLAVLSGVRSLIERFRKCSDTRVHCSPPSIVAIRAALHALDVNRRHGEMLRQRLSQLVLRLRGWAARAGLCPVGEVPFPMQSFQVKRAGGALRIHEALLRMGVRTVVTLACDGPTHRLTFLLTARHRFADVDFAGRMLAAHAAA
jgi:8-amino-7-oxononanoate synthase